MCVSATAVLGAGMGMSAMGKFSSGVDYAYDVAGQAGQILDSAKADGEQLQKSQKRRLSGMRAAYAKSGVKLTGTAKKLIEEQVREDDLESVKLKYNAQIASKQKLSEAKALQAKAKSDLFSDVSKMVAMGM